MGESLQYCIPLGVAAFYGWPALLLSACLLYSSKYTFTFPLQEHGMIFPSALHQSHSANLSSGE